MYHLRSQGGVTTRLNYDVLATPSRLLGRSYREWTVADLRAMLDHYRVSIPANMDKASLMHELNDLAEELGLTNAHRQAVLAGTISEASLPQRTTTQQRQNRPESRRQEDHTSIVPTIVLFPNLPRARRTVDDGPIITEATEIHPAQLQESIISSNASVQEQLQITSNSTPDGPECIVCLETLGQDEFPGAGITTSCDHEADICLQCIARSINIQLREKMWNELACPTCSAVLEFEAVKQFADSETFERYERLALEACLSGGSFQKCRAPGCTSGQEYSENDSFIICHECGGQTCTSCDTLWHAGLSCQEFVAARAQAQQATEEATNNYLANMSKVCPSCGVRGEKSEGCDHITCPRCRHEYCWECLADYAQIHLVGNTAHGQDCRYHSDNIPDRQAQAAARAQRLAARNANLG